MLFALIWTLVNATTVAAAATAVEEAFRLLQADQPSRSIIYFRIALRENPNDIKIQGGLAEAFYRMGNFSIAARYADQRVNLALDDKTWRAEWAKIVFALESRRYEVLKSVRKWFAEDPGDRALQVLLGRVLADLGEVAESRDVLKKSLTGTPDDVEALRILASMEEWDQRFAQSQELLQRANELLPHNAELREDLRRVTRIVVQLEAARSEPTLPLVIALIGLSTILGQTATRLGPRAYGLVTSGTIVLAGAALVWLYLVQIV